MTADEGGTAVGRIRSYDWIAHHAATRGEKEAMRDLASGRSFTYAQMNDRTNRLASALRHDFGVGRGDRVVVLAENDTNFFEVEFACWKLGAVFVPVNWRLTVPELEFIVGDCSPAAIIHDDGFAETAATLATSCAITHRISWGGGGGDAAPYEDAIAAAEPLAEAVATTHDDILTIMYTSGTTGSPKGAIITQGMTFWNAVNCVEFFGLGESMVNLAILPLFHTGGLNVFANPAFHFGATTLVVRAFDPAAVLDLLMSEEVGITHTIGVPANWLFMSQVPAFADASFPTLITPCVGGSPTPVPLIEAWASKGLPLQQAFGMTETSPLVLALKPEDCEARIGSAGLPALHTEVRVVTETGSTAAPGEIGELWVRGPNITPGYWNRPDANRDSFTDGWLHTGDAARTDDDGYYYIVDRWKDMYISGGENVYPAEVENVIYQLGGITEVAVIGVPDEQWVEVGRAVVVRAPGSAITDTEIVNHCRANLARFKVPNSVVFIDEIPHNATGKVLKRELRDSHGAP
ncbi:MAG: long-chain fatty acid--CoA ligase [Acidimicrobiia bacterium]|nr:long-chain fatty acid--CoA ligase [Acidimicrobiia bacterium]